MTRIPDELELPNVLDDIIASRLGEIGGGVCRVESFDRTSQTGTVTPVVKRRGESLPSIPSVPFLFPVAYQDVQEGTFGVLITTTENWRRWWRTGEADAAPEDSEQHGLSNGLFLPSLTTQGAPRSLGPDSTVLLRPTAGGTVHLGTWNANKAAVHQDLGTDFVAFLLAIDTWGGTAHANWAAAAAAWIANVRPALNTLGQGWLLGNYISPSVMVED